MLVYQRVPTISEHLRMKHHLWITWGSLFWERASIYTVWVGKAQECTVRNHLFFTNIYIRMFNQTSTNMKPIVPEVEHPNSPKHLLRLYLEGFLGSEHLLRGDLEH